MGSRSADVLIIGAGHAGVECAMALRNKGYTGTIALLGEESQLPYERPPLSKGMLAGTVDIERLRLRAAALYEKNAVTLELGSNVLRLDPEGRTATTACGETWSYVHCVIATGASARVLPFPDGDGVFSVRTIDDVLVMRQALQLGSRLLVIGGGYLGLEAACTAAGLGAQVVVFEQGPTIMPGRVSGITASRLHALHEDHGVRISTNCAVARWERNGATWRATTTKGETQIADMVLVAIGATPNTSIAEAAGITCDGGILVDETCRTSAPGVFAIGDCAAGVHLDPGRHIRIESVNNALVQAKTVAAVLTGNTPDPRRPPTFWSEQCGRRLQMAGVIQPQTPCEEIAKETARGWMVERYQHGCLRALEAVDSPVEFIQGVKRMATSMQVQ